MEFWVGILIIIMLFNAGMAGHTLGLALIHNRAILYFISAINIGAATLVGYVIVLIVLGV